MKVDHDYVLNVAKVAKECGCEEFHLVTTKAANKNSVIFGARVKGLAEEHVAELGFQRLSIYRPG